MLLRGKMLFSLLQSYSLLHLCAGGGGQSSQGLSVNGWGAAAKQDYRNGACAFKTRLRGAFGAPSPDGRCTSATFNSTERSCCYTRGNKGKNKNELLLFVISLWPFSTRGNSLTCTPRLQSRDAVSIIRDWSHHTILPSFHFDVNY